MTISVLTAKRIIHFSPAAIVLSVLTLLLWTNFDRLIYLTSPKISKPAITTEESQNLAPAGMKVTFKTKNIELDTDPVIYKTSSNNKLTEAKMSNITSVLGFSSQPEQSGSETKVWRKSKEVLTISQKNKVLDYSNNFTEADLAGYYSPDLGQTKLALEDFYQKLGFSSIFVNFDSPQSVLYSRLINIDGVEEKISPNEANYLTLTYQFLVNKQPLVSSYPTVLRVKATFGRGGKLVYLQTPIIFGDWQPDIKYSGLSEGRVKSELSRGKATLVKYDPVIHKSWPKVDPIKTLEITSLKSAYIYLTTDYPYILPIYIIEADGYTRAGAQIKVAFYLPAFSSSLLR